MRAVSRLSAHGIAHTMPAAPQLNPGFHATGMAGLYVPRQESGNASNGNRDFENLAYDSSVAANNRRWMRRLGTATNWPTPRVRADLLGPYWDAVGAGNNYLNILGGSGNTGVIPWPAGVGHSPATMLVVARRLGAVTAEQALFSVGATGNSTFYISMGAGSTFQGYVRTQNAITPFVLLSSGTITEGDPYALMLTTRGQSDHEIYGLNLVTGETINATSASSSGTGGTAPASLTIGYWSAALGAGSEFTTSARIYMCGLWVRGMAQAEMQEIARAPFGLLRPALRRLPTYFSTSLTYDDTITDGVVSGESPVATAQFQTAVIDTTPQAQDAVVADGQVYAAASDTVGATSSATGARVITKTITDSRPAIDNLPRITGVRVRNGATSDQANASVGETLTVRATMITSVSQTVTAGDSVSAGSETVSVQMTGVASATDAVASVHAVAATVLDDAFSADGVTAQAEFFVSTDNNIASTDDLGLDGHSVYRTTLTDVAVATEEAVARATMVPASTDTATAAEAAQAPGAFLSEADDDADADDSVASVFALPTATADAAGSLDALLAEVVVAASAADQVAARGYFNDNARHRRRVVWLS